MGNSENAYIWLVIYREKETNRKVTLEYVDKEEAAKKVHDMRSVGDMVQFIEIRDPRKRIYKPKTITLDGKPIVEEK